MTRLSKITMTMTILSIGCIAESNSDMTAAEEVVVMQDIDKVISEAYAENISSPSGSRASSIPSLYLGMGYAFMKKYNKDQQNKVVGHGVTAKIGYEIKDVVSIEGRYGQTMGDIRAHNKNNTWQLTNMALYLKPQYQVDTITLYALLGYGKSEFDDGTVHNEAGFQWGFGADFQMADHLSLFIDYINMYSNQGFDTINKSQDIYLHNVNMGFTRTF